MKILKLLFRPYTSAVIIALMAIVNFQTVAAQAPTLQITTADSTISRKITVIDIETMLPISNVNITTNNKFTTHTDLLGRAEIKHQFDTITFRHYNYSAEQLLFYELTDTMMLFPHHNLLQEVVVTGIGPDLRNAMKKAHENMLSQPVAKGLTFDFGLLLDKRARRDRKHLKRAKEVLRDYDLQPAYKP